MKHILYCKKCNKYSMNEICKECKEKTVSLKPPKFSPSDPYGRERRIAKKENEKNKSE